MAITGVTAVFFLWFLSDTYEPISFLRFIPFENLFGGVWMSVISIGFILEGMAGMPEVRKAGSKFGAFMLVAVGIFAGILAGLVFYGGVDILSSFSELRVATMGTLGIATLMWIGTIWSELVHRTAWVAHLRQTVG